MRKRIHVSIATIMVLLFFTAGNLMIQGQEIIFLTDDNNDDYNIEFLRNQGLNVTKFWGGDNISTWEADTLAMLDAADLVIIGRSITSSQLQESIDRAYWNAIKAPMVYNNPYHVRSTRNHLFNSASAVIIPAGSGTALIPDDVIFDDVTLASGDSLAWFVSKSNAILDLSGDNQGTIVAQLNDSIPLVVRFEANKAFYAGGPDSAVAERVYFGFGYEPGGPAHFPLTKDAKQVYLNEITGLLGIAQQTAVYSAADFSVVFLSDDNKDDYNIEFLRNQGLNVTKFWGGDNISTWEADTLAMLDAADLVIIGRSITSSQLQDSIDRAYWNAIKAPMVYISPYHVRNTRNHLFNSGMATTITSMTADINLPADTVFTGVTLTANTLDWFSLNSNCLLDLSGSSQGEMVASIGDTIPLLVRFDADKAFYVGGPDSAVAERVYFGFGYEPGGATHFPLSRDAKTVYLAEISRILGITPKPVVLGPPEFIITFMSDDENDDVQQRFLRAQGFKVNSFWVPEVKPSGWSQDTIEMLNNAELIIVGRSVSSINSRDIADRAVWNSLTTPLIHNSPYPVRSNRANWFNTFTIMQTTDNLVAEAVIADDPVFMHAPEIVEGEMDWLFSNSSYLMDVSGANNGTVVVGIGDTIPLLVRFDADKAFYPGGPDSAVAERVYFGFGTEPAQNYFPLTKNAQAVYFAEIMRLLGGKISSPEFFETVHTLESLNVNKGTLVPAFASDVFSYTLDLGGEDDILEVTAIATEASAMIEGAGNITIGRDTIIYVTCTSEIGQLSSYRIEITKELDPYISITSPNGGEKWEPGSLHNITWADDIGANVRIEYSDNGGSSWSSIISNTLSDGSYLWTVPSSSSVNCLIRITDISNASISDISNTFSIVPESSTGPPIKIAYIGNSDVPEYGDQIMLQVLNDLGFDVTYYALGVDNPVTGYDVVVLSETPSSGKAGWATYSTAPLPMVHFKVHALKSIALNWIATGDGVGGIDYDLSIDSVVKVIDATHPIMTGFTGEVQVVENVGAANEWNIGWINMPEGNGITVVGQSGTSEFNQQAIVAIEKGTVLNASVTTENRAVIVALHQACWTQLNDNGKTIIYNSIHWAANRKITPSDSEILVASPNGGESWVAGSNKNITWTSKNLDNVRIDYSDNSGSTWSSVINSTPSDGSYSWSLPNISSINCLIRITNLENEAILDESNSSFTIDQISYLNIINPNGGEELTINNEYSLEWTSLNISDVDIFYSVNNGTTWTSIEKNYPSTGIYSWNVIGPVSNLAKLKIVSAVDESVFDSSDEVFFIKEGAIDGISPDLVNTLDISFYPNPANNSFQIKGIEEKSTVKIFDLSGNLLLTKEVVANEIIEVDVLSQGLYILRIANSRGILQKKIVKR